MMQRIESLMRSGIESIDDYQTKRSILILNHICLVVAILNLSVFAIREFYFGYPSMDVLAGTLLVLLPILINQKGWINVSRLFFCYTGPLYMIHFLKDLMRLSETSVFEGFRIYILALSITPYLIFTRREWPLLVLAVLPGFLSIVMFPQLVGVLGGEYAPVPGSDYDLMYMRTVVGYLIIGTGSFIFNSIITISDDRTRQLIQLLKEKNNQIAVKNGELEEQRRRLSEMNSHLEELVDEKTDNIRQQNEILMRYAYTNAHKVRGPLARVLGLIRLSRMNNSPEFPWIFEKVEHEALAMDEIVNEISLDLDGSAKPGERDLIPERSQNIPV